MRQKDQKVASTATGEAPRVCSKSTWQQVGDGDPLALASRFVDLINDCPPDASLFRLAGHRRLTTDAKYSADRTVGGLHVAACQDHRGSAVAGNVSARRVDDVSQIYFLCKE